MRTPGLKAKIEELEAEARQRRDEIKTLKADLNEAGELVDKMREHVEDGSALIESWIEAFDMQLGDDGLWAWPQHELLAAYQVLLDSHNKLVRDWNKFIPEYNAIVRPRNVGRRLEASPSQVQDVRRLRKDGASLRGIAEQTGLSFRTVRTIVYANTDKERSKTNELRREWLDKMGAADFKAKKRIRDGLPKRITSALKTGVELIKASKGVGSR